MVPKKCNIILCLTKNTSCYNENCFIFISELEEDCSESLAEFGLDKLYNGLQVLLKKEFIKFKDEQEEKFQAVYSKIDNINSQLESVNESLNTKISEASKTSAEENQKKLNELLNVMESSTGKILNK